MSVVQPSTQIRRPSAAERVCIVLPTYNEAGNILNTLHLIFEKTRRFDADIHVLVVDDNSPDGTATLVKGFSRTQPKVHLLNRKEKSGLGAAYIAGMQYALKNLRPDIVFEMDADLSHNPKYIPSMIRAIRQGADMVIGSRYIEGGSLPSDWGARRVFMSKAANIYARTILRLPVKDCTGGFRAFRSSVLKALPLNELDVKGYAFQIVLLHHVVKRGFQVTEIPIHFADRTHGTSKLGISDIMELGVRIPLLTITK